MTITRHRVAALLAVDHFDVGATVYASDWGTTTHAGPPTGWTVTAPATCETKPRLPGLGLPVAPWVTFTGAGGDFRRTFTEVPAGAYYRTTIRVVLVDKFATGGRTVRAVAADIGDVIGTSTVSSYNGVTDVIVDAYNGGPVGTRGLVRLELWNATNTARAAGTVMVARVTVQLLSRARWLELHPIAARVTMDESWSPYVQAQLVCPMPDRSAVQDLDPRQVRRVTLTMTQSAATTRLVSYASSLWTGKLASYITTTYAGQTAAALTDLFGDPLNEVDLPELNVVRPLNLHLRRRSLDYVQNTMTLDLASDEALAQDYGRVSLTDVALNPPATTDLRTLVAWAINLIGGYLDAAATTAPIVAADVVWSLGQSVWEFLDPFVTAANLRLRCDESRVWHLEAPANGSAGTFQLTALTDLEDTLDREDWGDSVILGHEWADIIGGADTTTYAPATKALGSTNYTRTVRVVKRAKAAATTAGADALLSRISTRGRTVQVGAVNDYRVTPGLVAAFNTPVSDFPPVLVTAVTWEWPADEMAVTTRDIPL